MSSGVDVVLATGRSPWSGVGELADELRLPGPQITMQGALISEPATGAVHRLRTLPPATYREAIRLADELGLDPVVASLEGHRAERLPEGIDFLAVPTSEARSFRYVRDLDRLADEHPVRIYLSTGPQRHRQVRLAARERLGVRVSLVWTDLNGLEILAPGTNKGEAVSWLAAARGIGPDEVAAVGDATNDVEMLRMAGWSAAMGRAPEAVRAAADIVVRTSNDDGVIDAFAAFFPDLASEFGAGYRPARGFQPVA